MKRIISFTTAILLILSMAFSLSSCLSTIIDVISPELDLGEDGGEKEGATLPEEGEGENSSGGNTENSSGNLGDGNGSSTDPGASGEDNIFLPGYDGSIEIAQNTRAILSVVSIIARFEVSYSGTGGSVGSGVIYEIDRENGDAYIITNYHVVYNRYATTRGGISNDIGVYLYGQENEKYKIQATYVGGSLTQDLALLKVTGSEVLKNSYARAADLGDSDTVAVMDNVIAIGNPEGYGMSVTTGIVSVDSETLNMTGADARTALSLRVIRIDAAINEGNSGGGLFDENGYLIGIVNAKRTGSDVDNIAYAIPVSYAINFIENIRYYCDGTGNTTPYKCKLGITVGDGIMGIVPDPETGKLVKKSIVVVTQLEANSVYNTTVEVGDALLSITVDGVKKDVTRVYHLIDHMLTAKVGSTVTLEIEKNGTIMTETVIIPESALTAVN